MISLGKKITSPQDKLQKADLFELYQRIATPAPELQSQINSLRTILNLDVQKYRKLKTQLPYFCSSVFVPPFRKNENFAATQHFVLDIDHISEADINLTALKIRLAQDDRIALLFTSPGNNGLKLLFNLSEKCYDRGKYSIFYKLFARKFAEQYKLMQVLDSRTSDVARACFLSVDKEAYFNEQAQAVVIADYINFENQTELQEAEGLFKQIEKEEQAQVLHKEKTELPDDIFLKIRKQLNPKIKTKKEKHIIVPEKLNEVMNKVEMRCKELGLNITEITNINYGKKLHIELKGYWAELNVFYGKKGFTVVKTPKRGSSTELADTAHALLCEILYPENS